MPPIQSLLKRLIRIATASTLGFIGVTLFGLPCFLFFTQHSMIYHPRPYFSREEEGTRLDYATSEGHEFAYYIPPDAREAQIPDRIWVMFPGNGSLAMDWLQFVKHYPVRKDAFLLLDYPGYGRCEGSASPQSIEESAEAALQSLAARLHTSVAELEPKLGLVGHSLGCAAGLNFAVHHPVERLVLIAPFTNLRAMAQKTVGWPLCWLLRHNFDNRARLAELAARKNPPRVDLFHGADDEMIPVQMGRGLAAEFTRMITFHEIPEGGHNTILVMARPQVFEAMQKSPRE